jgi:hypothetical protein
MAERLRGRVVRVSLRQLRSGEIAHDTRIEFDADQRPYNSVRIKGRLPAIGWDDLLLAALQSRYDVANLPEPRWRAKAAA